MTGEGMTGEGMTGHDMTAPGMTVEPIPVVCRGHGRCVKICPEIFELDAITNCVNVKDGKPPPELYDKVRKAAYACPTKAILLSFG